MSVFKGAQGVTRAAIQAAGALTDSGGDGSALTVRAAGGSVDLSFEDRFAERINVRDQGAVGDTRTVYVALTITATQKTLTAASSAFLASDVGKRIIVPGAGASGAPLSTTVASFTSSTSITLTDAATTSLSASSKIVTIGTDDTAAFNAAIAALQTSWNAGVQKYIYAPAGVYLITDNLTTFHQVGGSVIGDGNERTWIKIDPSVSGALFSWSECWMGGTPGFVVSNTTAPISTGFAGPTIRGINVVGDVTSPNTQDAFVFYDRNDHIVMSDVFVQYITGTALSLGTTTLNTSQAYFRECFFQNLRFEICGGTSSPVMEIGTVGTGDSSNTNVFHCINMWDCGGPGVIISNQNPSKTTGAIKFFGLRIEGGRSGVTATQLQIGQSTDTGAVSNLYFYGLELLAGAAGQTSLVFDAASNVLQPFSIFISGALASAGDGISINAGRAITFQLYALSAAGTDFATSNNGKVGSGIYLDANGTEALLTYNIANSGGISTPMRAKGPGVGTAGIAGTVHDGSTAGGNNIGQNAVDLCLSKTAATQVAGGQNSAMLGGSANTATGFAAVCLGGTGQLIAGNYSIGGGNGAADFGNYGSFCYASGNNAAQGDAQACCIVLRAHATTGMRLTSNGNSAGTTNTVNPPNNHTWNGSLRVSCRDMTSAGNDASFLFDCVQISRDANAASTVVLIGGTSRTSGSPATGTDAVRFQSRGTGSSVTIAISADTTNGGLNVTVTPPNSNQWHCTAKFDFLVDG